MRRVPEDLRPFLVEGVRLATGPIARSIRTLTRAGGRTGHVPEAPKRILLIAIHYLGDTILTLPLLESMRERWPDARIQTWCAPRSRELLEAMGLEQVLASGAIPSDRTREQGGSWRARFELLARLRHLRPDLIVDASGVPWTALLGRLAGASCIAGWSDQGLEAWYDIAVPYDCPVEHLLDRRTRLGQALGVHLPATRFPVLPPTALKGGDMDAGGGIILHVGAGWAAKRWPANHWGSLVHLLATREERPIVLTCGPGEEEVLETARRAAGLPRDSAMASTSLHQLAALLRSSQGLIVADAGPAHLAAALGTRVLALFGPTDPRCCQPLGPRARVLRSPSTRMADLTAEAVAAAWGTPE